MVQLEINVFVYTLHSWLREQKVEVSEGGILGRDEEGKIQKVGHGRQRKIWIEVEVEETVGVSARLCSSNCGNDDKSSTEGKYDMS